MKEDKQFDKLQNRARNLCDKSEKCTSEIEKKLREWGAFDFEIPQIIEQLKKEKFIDEKRYAIAFKNDKLNINNWGRIKISYQLRRRKIPEAYIQNAMSQIDEKVYKQILHRLVDNKLQHTKAKNNYAMKAKILRFTYARGFENGLVIEVLDELL